MPFDFVFFSPAAATAPSPIRHFSLSFTQLSAFFAPFSHSLVSVCKQFHFLFIYFFSLSPFHMHPMHRGCFVLFNFRAHWVLLSVLPAVGGFAFLHFQRAIDGFVCE